nr:MAG TPA: hypothetical protein [Caudoviricetes sp.]
MRSNSSKASRPAEVSFQAVTLSPPSMLYSAGVISFSRKTSFSSAFRPFRSNGSGRKRQRMWYLRSEIKKKHLLSP